KKPRETGYVFDEDGVETCSAASSNSTNFRYNTRAFVREQISATPTTTTPAEHFYVSSVDINQVNLVHDSAELVQG
ncbi:unnamed protein product, partial [Amoebophrya sp. A25]